MHAASLHSIKSETQAAGSAGGRRHCSSQASSAASSCVPAGTAVTAGCHCFHSESHPCACIFPGERRSHSSLQHYTFPHAFLPLLSSLLFFFFLIFIDPHGMMSLLLLFLPPLLVPHPLPPLPLPPPTEGYLCSVIGSFSHFSV